MSVFTCLPRRFSSVYWTESLTDRGSSLYRHDGQMTQMVLGAEVQTRSQTTESSCSCPVMTVSGMFAVDTTASDVDGSEALFVWDRQTGMIWTSDRHGCHCRLLRGAVLGQPHIGSVTILPYVSRCASYSAVNLAHCVHVCD